MSGPEESEDSYEHYCVDCTAVVNSKDKVCGTCGADVSQFIKNDEGEEPELDAQSADIDLIPNERIISTRRGLIVTSHRVRSESQSWGVSQIKSIMLEELASCVVTRLSYPVLLVLAALVFFVGVIAGMNNDAIQLFIGTIIGTAGLVAIYFATRQQILLLESSGTEIKVNVEAVNLIDLRELIDEIERAKNERYITRCRTSAPR